MTKKIKVGIIGCGGISRAHLHAYKTNREVEVKAVVDLDINKAKALGKEYGVRWYTDIDKMLDNELIEAVSICTPPKTHYSIVLSVAQRKIHILCEKALTIDTRQAKEMIQIANKNGILFLVAMCHRFHEPVARLRKAINAGKIGKVVSYRNRFQWLDTLSTDAARLRGGILLDNGSHSIDIFRFLIGEIRRVNAFFSKKVKAIEDIRTCFITLESNKGVAGIIELDGCSSASKGKNIIEVYGDKGSGVIDYSGNSFYHNVISNRRVGLDTDWARFPNRFQGEVNHFIDCLKGRAKPLIGAIEGLKDIEVIEAIFKAGRVGKTVTI